MAERPGLEVPPVQIAPQTTTAQESTPLIADGEDIENSPDYQSLRDDSVSSARSSASPRRSILGIISVLLIGVFVSQADTTLVIATYAHITSDFNRIGDGNWIDGSWILTSFGLATCATQPIYGKLSDILGRKAILQTSYVLFLVGTSIAGLSRGMLQIILGRVIQGAGGAGMVSMVSILLTDLVPLHEVAAYRSYVNIFATVGRSCGGLLGGYLTQSVGWRWAFLCQCPLLVLSIVLVGWKLEEPSHANSPNQGISTKLKRIDFIGAFFMSIMILACISALDLSGKKSSWDSPLLIILILITLIAGALFAFTEKFWAKEPIFPLGLLGNRAVVTSYSILFIQTGIQVALMFTVPMYFQVTSNASMGQAGAHLIPAIIGNTIGGLAVGAWIKRTGRYKPPTVVSSLFAMTCFALLIIFWRGRTNVFASLFIFLGGCATGMAHSAVFVGLTAGVAKQQMAIAASGLYLSVNIGAVAGVSVASAIFQSALRSNLGGMLRRVPDGQEIARNVMSDVVYVQSLHGPLHHLVVRAFVKSFQRTYTVQIALASTALVIGILTKQKKITH